MNLNNKSILFISARFPYPLDKGDRLVLFNNIKLASKEFNVTLFTMYDENDELINLDKLKKYCVNIVTIKRSKIETYFNLILSLLTLKPLQVAYYESKKFQKRLDELLLEQQFDILHVYMLRMAHYIENLDYFKILSLIDSMSLNISRRVKSESGLKKIIFKYEYFLIKNYEINMVDKFDKSLVVSNIDKDFIGKKNIKVLPVGVDILKCTKSKELNKIVFTGNMGYFPNQNAVVWFVDNCFESIKKEIPSVSLVIVGKNPPKFIQDYHDDNNIFIKGFVESMVDEICSASISIAPMQSGSGMQIKILEAMSLGLPVVATELGRGDIMAIDKKSILIANTADQFSNACIELLNNKKKQDLIGNNAKIFINNSHSWEKIRKQYLKVYKIGVIN
jgi:polysaccharide biosynthesis protein PslH